MCGCVVFIDSMTLYFVLVVWQFNLSIVEVSVCLHFLRAAVLDWPGRWSGVRLTVTPRHVTDLAGGSGSNGRIHINL